MTERTLREVIEQAYYTIEPDIASPVVGIERAVRAWFGEREEPSPAQIEAAAQAMHDSPLTEDFGMGRCRALAETAIRAAQAVRATE